jgi:hypothetical protein
LHDELFCKEAVAEAVGRENSIENIFPAEIEITFEKDRIGFAGLN